MGRVGAADDEQAKAEGGPETPGRPGEGGMKSRKCFQKKVIQLCQRAHREAGWQDRELGLLDEVSVSHKKGRGKPSHAGINEPNSRGHRAHPQFFPSHTATRRQTEKLRLCSSNYWHLTVLFFAVTSIYIQYIKYKNVFTTTKHRTQKYTFGQISQEHAQKESIRMGEFVCFSVIILKVKFFKD